MHSHWLHETFAKHSTQFQSCSCLPSERCTRTNTLCAILTESEPGVTRRTLHSTEGRTSLAGLRRAVVACAHIHCKIEMHDSPQRYRECFLVHAVLCVRTSTCRFGVVDRVPRITMRALCSAVYRASRAAQRHAVCACATIGCEKTQKLTQQRRLLSLVCGSKNVRTYRCTWFCRG